MPLSYSVRFESDVAIPLRDGTVTYTDVYRPAAPGRFPAILVRTPYDKGSLQTRSGSLDFVRAAGRGYAVVVQDVRGRYSSQGDFYPFVHEMDDGYDSVEWVAAQPWCDGKVGMHGVSYVGATQWLAAKARPPSLKAIAPGVTASDYHEGWAWQGGAFELGFNLSWTIGPLTVANWANLSRCLGLSGDRLNALIDAKDDLTTLYRHLPLKGLPHLRDVAPYYYDWLDHPEYDDYWRSLCIEESHHEIAVPAFNWGGWYDIFLGGTIRNFLGMREKGATPEAREGQRLVIGPWVHSGSPINVSGEYNFGTRASSVVMDLPGLLLDFYDLWLKGEDNRLSRGKPVLIFTMGVNRWREEDRWPPEGARPVRYYLHSRGKANTLHGDGLLGHEEPGDEPPDAYVYNPLDPVPTRGGGLCCDPAFMASGAYDHRPIEMRNDVLVYTTPPLERDLEVTGPLTLTLYASSSAPDTDFTAKLLDVAPCGYARNLTDGIVRARYRTPRAPASLLRPGDVYRFNIDLWATSNVFKKGHRIRLEVSSSNFPRFDRNANTGAPIGEDEALVPALQQVFHSREYPSHLTLSVVERD